jgi:hypothetical protein
MTRSIEGAVGQDGNESGVLNDPLWAAAVPLADAVAVYIRSDLARRRVALNFWRVLEVAAARGSLTEELLDRGRSAEDLAPYPHARARLTRLKKDIATADAISVRESLAKHGASMSEDIAGRGAALRLWMRLHAAMAAGRLQIAQRILLDPRLAATLKLYPELAQKHNRVSISVRRALDRGLTVLRDEIVRFAEERRWQIVAADRRIVIDHLITIELAEDRTTRVQSVRVRSLAWEAVRPVLDSEHERVWGRARRDSGLFVTGLDQYLASRRGENVRLRDAYEALKESRPPVPGRLASYYKDEFSADLSVLLTTPAARRFEFSAIRDPRLAFPVVQAGGSLQQYGFVRPRGA